MSDRLKAVYRGGAFVLETPCDLPEGARVELVIQGPPVLSPPVTESEARVSLLKQLALRMGQNSLPAQAPRYARDQLHERR